MLCMQVLTPLIKLMASNTLISGVKWKASWKEFYVQKPVKSKASQNHVQMEEASVLCHGPPCFPKKNYVERFFKWDRFSKRDNNNLRKKPEKID